MPTTEDLVGSSATQSAAGVEIQRVFHVSEIAGDPSAKPNIALTADKIPTLGDPHPNNGALIAVNKSVKFIDSSNAAVTVSYRIPRLEKGDPPPGGIESAGEETSTNQDGTKSTITVGASLTNAETSTDKDGNQLVVAHNVTTSEFNEDFTDTIETDHLIQQVRTVSYQKPQMVMRIQRLEPSSPAAIARYFVGYVNSKAIGKSLVDGPRFWLCTRIDGVSNDGGSIYNVTYEFQHNRDTWSALVHWIDPETGLPVPDGSLKGLNFLAGGGSTDESNTGLEHVRYDIYPETDFNDLGLWLET